VRKQYGQILPAEGKTSASLEQRGVFQLQKQRWIASSGDQPPVLSYIREYANIAGPDGTFDPFWGADLWDAGMSSITLSSNTIGYPGYNLSFNPDFERVQEEAGVNTINPDPMHYWLFQDIVSQGGSVAFALQSMLTTLASMTYYDQLAQFDNVGPVSQSVFIETNMPKAYCGWLVVVLMLTIHIIVSWSVMIRFIAGTRKLATGRH
jgi:hypothetical protein